MPGAEAVDSSNSSGSAGLFAHGAGSLAAGISSQLLTIVSAVLAARLLGPAGKGELTAILLWPALLASIGGLNSLGESIVFSVAKSSQEARRSMSATILALTAVQAAVLTAISFAVLPLVFSKYSTSVLESLRLYLVWIPLGLATSNGLSILLGRQQVGLFNALRNVAPGVTAIGLVVLTSSHIDSLRPVVVVYLAASTLAALAVLAAVVWQGVAWPSARGIKSMLAYMLKAHPGSLSGLANERADQALISVWLPPSSLGLYSVAVSVTSPVVMIGASLAPLVLAKTSTAPTVAERGRRLAVLVKGTAVLSVAIALVILLFTKPVITLAFGSAFEGAILSTQILLIAACALSIKSVLGAGLKGSNRPFATSAAEMVSAVATIALLIVLLPRFGIIGAAIASCIAYWGSAAYMLLAINRAGVAKPLDFVPRTADFKVWYLASRLRLRSASAALK